VTFFHDIHLPPAGGIELMFCYTLSPDGGKAGDGGRISPGGKGQGEGLNRESRYFGGKVF